MHSYMFDNASVAEYDRLDLMSENFFDPQTRAVILNLGLHEGWRCLELGGGNGSITEWLCDKVGNAGAVTSVDINPRMIELIGAENLIEGKPTCAPPIFRTVPTISLCVARCFTKLPVTHRRDERLGPQADLLESRSAPLLKLNRRAMRNTTLQ